MYRFNIFRAAAATVAALSLLGATSSGFAQTKAQPDKTKAAPAASAAATRGKTLTKDQKQSVLDELNDVIEKRAFVPGVDFQKWTSFLAEQNPAIEKAETTQQLAGAVNEALSKFGFSHIVLISPEAAEARVSHQSVGVGILLQPEDDGLRVLNVFDNTPAKAAGLENGDLIIESAGKKPKSPVELLGEEGSTLQIKVKKNDGKVKEYKLKRQKYSNVRPETLTWPRKDTAMVTIHTFDISYDKNNVEKLMKDASSAKNLIVDLRSNPGGRVTNLMHFMGLVLPADTPIGTFISKYTVEKYKKEVKDAKDTDLVAMAHWSPMKIRAMKNDIPPFKGHIAVLINGGSGSAAEIAAAALQDSADAAIVGSKSAGAVLVSVMNPLPQGFVIQYPITDFLTMNGVRLEGTGVTPMVETPAVVRYNEPDQAVDKAILLLERAALRDGRTRGTK